MGDERLMEIWCFSGTGNSLRIAQDLGAVLGAHVLDIAERVGSPVVTDAKALGIVFPVYFEALPEAVKHFARCLHASKKAYIFAVCTYGGAAGVAVKQLREELVRGGFELSAVYGVPMPQNSFRKPLEDRQKLLDKWKKRMGQIAARTQAREKGARGFNRPVEAIIRALYPVVIRPAVVKQLAALSGLPRNTPMGQLISHADASYAVSGACIGCGVCADECPVGNIVMEQGSPVWQGRCELCTRCYHICPQRAISGGVVEPGFYYTPEHVAAGGTV